MRKMRQDRSSTAYGARVLKRLEKEKGAAEYARFVGRAVGDGYVIVATDGQRALCRRGEAVGDGTPPGRLAEVTSQHRWFILNTLDGPLRRARAVVDLKRDPVVKLAIDPTRAQLHIWAKDTGVVESHETAPIAGELAGTVVLVNVKYLLDGLGRPARCWYLPHTPDKPLIVESDGGAWRYLIQPCTTGRSGGGTGRGRSSE